MAFGSLATKRCWAVAASLLAVLLPRTRSMGELQVGGGLESTQSAWADACFALVMTLHDKHQQGNQTYVRVFDQGFAPSGVARWTLPT
eukprot:s1072_g21.t1